MKSFLQSKKMQDVSGVGAGLPFRHGDLELNTLPRIAVLDNGVPFSLIHTNGSLQLKDMKKFSL